MAGWHHQCNEYELWQTSGDGEGQGGLVCCSPWGCKESMVSCHLQTVSFISSPISLERDKCRGQMQTAFVEKKRCEDAEAEAPVFWSSGENS